MKIKNQITLSLGAPNASALSVKQGDIDSREVECILVNEGVEVTIPQDATARVAFCKPDGKQVLNDAEIVENHVIFLLTQQMLAVCGDAQCEIMITKEEALLSSAVFPVYIQPSGYDSSAIESSPEYHAFTNTLLAADGAIQQANQAAQLAQDAVGKAQETAEEAQSVIEQANATLNFSSLTSGTLPQWNGSQLVNGVAVSSVVSPNLLINPGFSINQRGQSSYSNTNQYTVDRWMLLSGSVSNAGSDNGIALSSASVCQFVEGMSFLSGATLTLSASINGATQKISGVLSTSAVSGNGLSFVWTSTGYIKVTITGNGNLSWAKLELGSTNTPYCPPDLTAELLKCQRYYYAVWRKAGYLDGRGNPFFPGSVGGGGFYPQGTFPVPMRTEPQVTLGPDLMIWSAATGDQLVSQYTNFRYDYDDNYQHIRISIGPIPSNAVPGQVVSLSSTATTRSMLLSFDAEITS